MKHIRVALLSLTTVLAASFFLPAPSDSAQFLNLPAEAGSEWRILAGYNTATHSVADSNDPYALDIERVDAPTAGSVVYAPVSGPVQYADSKCVGLRDSTGASVLLCHLFPDPGLRGKVVARGQRLGVVAPAGEAGNNGVAHIHIALTAPNRGGPLPFSGSYALEGIDLPLTGEPGAYTGTTFRSTIRRAPSANAGADQSVRPRAGVTLSAVVDNPEGGSITYTWAQASGPSVVLTGGSTTVAQFTAPSSTGTLQFRFTVTELATGEQFSDTVAVRVTTTGTISLPSGPPSGSTRIVSGSVPASGGFGLIVFSGGTSEQLLAASGCPRATSAFWTAVGGDFAIFVPGSQVVVVNAEWNRIFGNAIPANTPLLARCR